MTNIFGTLTDEPDDPYARTFSLAERELTMLAEQTLILERLDRSLESLVFLTLRVANALESLADVYEEQRSNHS